LPYLNRGGKPSPVQVGQLVAVDEPSPVQVGQVVAMEEPSPVDILPVLRREDFLVAP
jgi:hypothetical protein